MRRQHTTIKHDKWNTGVQGTMFMHVTFHDRFTPRTNIQHFTKSHAAISSVLARKHSHSFVIAQTINGQKLDPFCKYFLFYHPNPELCFVILLGLRVLPEVDFESSTSPAKSESWNNPNLQCFAAIPA